MLWLCREGLISREEITAYFMRASVICSKLGLGFVHNFQETTYMKPTFCDNCSGFVSHHKNLMKYRNWFTAMSQAKKIPQTICILVFSSAFVSVISIFFFTAVGCHQARLQMQRWLLQRSCATRLCLDKCQLVSCLKMRRGTHLSYLVGSRYSEAIFRQCSVVLCCIQLAEPCSTRVCSQNHSFSPSPVPPKIWELFVCLTVSMQKGLRLCICRQDGVQRQSQCV